MGLGATPGLERVTSMTILGFAISDTLGFGSYAHRICCRARQSFWALRTLVAHGLRGPPLHDVVRATTLARMLYASPDWWGFTNRSERDRLQAVVSRLVRFKHLPDDTLTFEQMCQRADTSLFSAVLADSGLVLHDLLPPVKVSTYHLRPRAHDHVIPPADSLMRKTYISRMLFEK